MNFQNIEMYIIGMQNKSIDVLLKSKKNGFSPKINIKSLFSVLFSALDWWDYEVGVQFITTEWLSDKLSDESSYQTLSAGGQNGQNRRKKVSEFLKEILDKKSVK